MSGLDSGDFWVGSGGFGWFQVVSGGFGWVRLVSVGFGWFQILSITITGCDLSFFTQRLIPHFRPFLKISISEFLIQDLTSRLIVNENGISIYQSLSLGFDDQKQVKV